MPRRIKWFADGSIVEDYTSELGDKHSRIKTKVDDTDKIQTALDSSFKEIVFNPGVYYITSPLVLKGEKRLILQGSTKLGLEMNSGSMKNACIIFSDIDITLLKIAVVNEDCRFNNTQQVIDYTGKPYRTT